jgi:hypothetical protein
MLMRPLRSGVHERPLRRAVQAANLDPDELSGIERRTLLGTAADSLIPRLTDIGG